MIPELTICGRVATITLRRPETANRLDSEDLSALIEHIDVANKAEDVLVLRLQANGKYFCSGYDILRIGTSQAVAFDQVVNALEDARPITIALIQGGVYGGATDLALACDFRLGVPHANMFMPAARLGLHFYQRGLERYVSRLGLNTAKRLFLMAETIDAAEMKTCGFLTHLVESDVFRTTAESLTQTLSGMAPIALCGMKKHLNRIANGTLDIAELRVDIERSLFSEDLREGTAAWAAKRPARFNGR
ncbi:Enoyl-CoA hydratase/carnithine racemase [Collimonas sp. OK607]|uniref:enoyl-CoA hydratase/isomerase family protein n=1 Tax=Collimonas sp. OK607 TaxID=1798194 RepID=UPI0008E9F584|nr:enoyl-CoA hydratase/isomerase family protein [Collimonas sp. OK607]SFA82768.1 Enoyl-CoA hydratase/carnithine racemase [Collimonas sp. OK607]